jgi:hypothetical protein
MIDVLDHLWEAVRAFEAIAGDSGGIGVTARQLDGFDFVVTQ